MARRRDNLIAFRTTEGSPLEAVHEKAKADGQSIKAILEGWAVAQASAEREKTDEHS